MLQYFSWMVVIHHDYVKQINSLIFMDTLLKSQELCLLLLRIPRNKTHSPLFWQIKLRSPPKLQSQATGTGVLCEWRCWSLRNRRRRGYVKVEATGLGLEAWHWGKLCKYMQNSRQRSSVTKDKAQTTKKAGGRFSEQLIQLRYNTVSQASPKRGSLRLNCKNVDWPTDWTGSQTWVMSPESTVD